MFIETFRCQVLCSVPGPGAAVMKELERTPALVDGEQNTEVAQEIVLKYMDQA